MTERRRFDDTSITDVPGIRVGHATRRGDGWLTGTTVVLPPRGTVGGVDVRGGGPGTHETDALDPRTLVATVDAVVLTGGSAFGLVTAHGAQRWCAHDGRGVPVGPGPTDVVPIVPAAAVFDLGRGGDFAVHPTEEMGHAAAVAAAGSGEHALVPTGTVGAGTGTRVARRAKGGVGTASIRLAAPDSGVVVGALAVVNAHGAPVFGAGEGPQTAAGGPVPQHRTSPGAPASPLNTTLAVVATNARLDPAETSRTATCAHDGLARALDPAHTLVDGDTVFALATGAVELAGADRGGRVASLVAVQAAAAEAVRRAVLDGVLAADPASPADPTPSWAQLQEGGA